MHPLSRLQGGLEELYRVATGVRVTDFVVDYSSPGVKGRPIWGALVPYDQPWRSGARC